MSLQRVKPLRGRQEFELLVPPSVVYRATSEPLPAISDSGQHKAVQVKMSVDSGSTWRSLNMRLAPRSWWLAPFVTWPPERLHLLSLSDGRLCMEYDDEWVPFEKPLAGMAEARWRATYSGHRFGWNLKRLAFLDYE
jgi:hypothetical protein